MMNTESKLNIQFLMFLFFMLYHLTAICKEIRHGFLGGLIFAVWGYFWVLLKAL